MRKTSEMIAILLGFYQVFDKCIQLYKKKKCVALGFVLRSKLLAFLESW